MQWLSDKWRTISLWYRQIGWAKRRIVGIVAALIVAWLFTSLAVYLAKSWAASNGDDLIIGIASAWTGELLFFTVVGAIVAIITLRDPAKEAFDERVRILFGVGPDSVLSYNKRELSRLSAYAETGARTVILENYDAGLQAYKGRIKTSYRFRNLLHDVDYDDALQYQVFPDKFPPGAVGELGRVLSIRVDNLERIQQAQIIRPEGYTTELRLIIPANQVSEIVFEYWVWLKTEELQEFRPRRVVEQYTMSLTNQCDVTARLEIDGDQRGTISLLYNQPVAFSPVQGVSPGERIFIYKLLPPTAEPAPVNAAAPA